MAPLEFDISFNVLKLIETAADVKPGKQQAVLWFSG